MEISKVNKDAVIKLEKLILKMAYSLEEDLHKIACEENKIQLQKTISSTAQNLVTLLIRLSKLRKDENLDTTAALPKDDIAIIERFLKRNKIQCHSRAPCHPREGGDPGKYKSWIPAFAGMTKMSLRGDDM